jgi:hypothetical protein
MAKAFPKDHLASIPHCVIYVSHVREIEKASAGGWGWQEEREGSKREREREGERDTLRSCTLSQISINPKLSTQRVSRKQTGGASREGRCSRGKRVEGHLWAPLQAKPARAHTHTLSLSRTRSLTCGHHCKRSELAESRSFCQVACRAWGVGHGVEG